VLFLLPGGAKNEDEHVGDPQLRGVCGELTDSKLLAERGRGREGWGKTMARAGTTDGRRVCMTDDNKNQKERIVD